MSLISDLCRLCLANCRLLGISVYPNDMTRDKIRECLSIIIEDDVRFPLIICNDCDNKLNCFYQFRIDSVRVQHEIANILKSHHPVHYETNHIEYYNDEPIRPIDDNMYVNVNTENMYTSTPAPATIQSSHDYDHQCSYIEHDLHLALDDDNQTDSQSLVNMSNNENLYQTVHQPRISPLSPATTPTLEQTSMTPQLVQTPLTSANMESSIKTEYYVDEPSQVHYNDSTVVLPENSDCYDAFPQDDNNSFTYDDFDESCQSVPSDRNNVDNAIDKKIEEFIQGNKRGTKAPKICTVCNKLFRTNYKLRVHMETHAENSVKFSCNFDGCTKTFKSKIGLQEHAARHTGSFKFSCEICDKKFLLKSYFVAHQRIHSSDNTKTFACTLCPKSFKSKQNLIDHENCHLGLKNFKCDKCDKSFNTKTHHDVHYKSHLQIEQFECSVCLKSFKTKNYLNTHMKTHFDHLKNYSCGECGKKFIQLSDLKIHYRTHTREKSFVCETCGSAFARKDSLDVHRRTHLDIKQFSCEKCSRQFTRKNTLNSHSKRCFVESQILNVIDENLE